MCTLIAHTQINALRISSNLLHGSSNVCLVLAISMFYKPKQFPKPMKETKINISAFHVSGALIFSR